MDKKKTPEVESITMPFRMYMKAWAKAIRKNPKAKTMTVTFTLPCSNRVNAFRSDPGRPTRYDLWKSKKWAWTVSAGRRPSGDIETISIPLTSAGRAAVRRQHNAKVTP